MANKYYITSESRPNIVERLDLEPVDFRAKIIDVVVRASGQSLPKEYMRHIGRPAGTPTTGLVVAGGVPKEWVDLITPIDDPAFPKGEQSITPKEWLETSVGDLLPGEDPKGSPLARGGIPKEWIENPGSLDNITGVVDALVDGDKKDGKDDSKDGKDDSGKEEKDGKEGKDGKDGSDGSEDKEMCDKCDSGYLEDALIIYGPERGIVNIDELVGPFL